MDSLGMLVLTLACVLCWFVAIADKTTSPLYRAAGILFGVPVCVWYFLDVIAHTKSPLWNDIQGGPVAAAAMALGIMAFLSRVKRVPNNGAAA